MESETGQLGTWHDAMAGSETFSPSRSGASSPTSSSSPSRSSVEYATTGTSSVINLDQEPGARSWREWSKSRTVEEDALVSFAAFRGSVPKTLSTDSTDDIAKQQARALSLALSSPIAQPRGTLSAEQVWRSMPTDQEFRRERDTYRNIVPRSRTDSVSQYYGEIPTSRQRQNGSRDEVREASRFARPPRPSNEDYFRDSRMPTYRTASARYPARPRPAPYRYVYTPGGVEPIPTTRSPYQRSPPKT